MSSARGVASPLEQALVAYQPVDAVEQRDVTRLLDLAASSAPFDRSRALHVTCSALVVNPRTNSVLLRFHPRLGRWLQVGGHADDGEHDPFAIAAREALEESGLGDLVSFPDRKRPRLVQVVVVEVGANRSEAAHEHGDLRYLLATARPDLAMAESADAPLRWVGIDEALEEPLEEGLRRGIARVRALM